MTLAATQLPPTGNQPVSSDPNPRSHTIYQPALTGTDRFLEMGGKFVEKIAEHRVTILVGVIGIFTVAAGVGGYGSWQNRQNEKGAEEVYRITSKLPGNEDELTRLGINMDDVPRSPEEEKERAEKYGVAAEALDKVADSYSGLTSGTLARIEQAVLLDKSGKKDEAVAAYKEAFEQTEEPTFKYRAGSGWADVLRSQSKLPEAIAQYQSLASSLTGVWKAQATLELGRTYELSGDSAKATETYEGFLKEFSSSDLSKDVQARLVALKAGASVGKAAPEVAPAAAPEAAPVAAPEAAPAAAPEAAPAAAPEAAPVAAPAPAASAPAAPTGGAPQ